ncbi:MAG: tetratricopeptide repeat protein [Hyphomicrobium sp.]|nr:tetratricopeptide repeat protein [Hyphomicrobium sp.]
MRSSLRKLLHSTATAIGMFTASLSASQAANEFTTDSDSHSLLGSYLAANLAKGSNDNNSAAAFYRSALALDPSNAVLLEQAFQTEAAEGHWDRAVPLARQLVAKDAENRMAHLLLGLDSFKGGDYQKADEEFRKASDGPIGELTSALARAWAAAAAGNAQRALKLLEMPKQAEWAQFYLNYHKALIADVMGRPQEAQVAYEHSMRQDATTLRIALAFARHAAHEGNFKRAKEILDAQSERAQSDPHVLVRELRDAIGPDKKTELLITTPVEGMAEVFYGLGEALTSEGRPQHGRPLLAARPLRQAGSRLRACGPGQRLRNGPALPGCHRCLRPHSTGHGPAVGDRHPQGVRSQFAGKGRRGQGDLRPPGQAEPRRLEAARRTRQHPARAQALRGGGRGLYAGHEAHSQAG